MREAGRDDNYRPPLGDLWLNIAAEIAHQQCARMRMKIEATVFDLSGHVTRLALRSRQFT